MNIIKIINEELENLNERQEGVYTIPELVQRLKIFGLSQNSLDIYQNILLAAYQEGGDDAVVNTYNQMAGVEIEPISKGRYMFQSIVDPEKLKESINNFNKILNERKI